MKKTLHFGLFILLAASIVVPNLSFAQTDNGVGSGDPKSSTFQLVPCTGVKKADGTGKECDFADLLILARRLIQFTLYIITPIVVGMILFTGFKYVTAGGDARLVEDAKRMFKPIILGIILVFAAWVLVYTVLDKLLANKIGDINKSDIVPGTIR